MKIDMEAAINWYVEREKEKELAGLRAALRLARGLEPHGTHSEEELRLIAAKRKLAELEAAEKENTSEFRGAQPPGPSAPRKDP